MIQPNFSSIRKNYPLLGNCTYLNTANAGAMSQTTLAVGQKYLEEYAHFASQKLPSWITAMEETRDTIARWLHATRDEIGLVWDTSYGISWVEKMLPADMEVVLMEHDFAAVTLPWIHSGRKIHWVKWDMNRHIDLEDLEKKLSGKPKVLAISHVQYTTGYRVDISAISAMCKRQGACFVLDAIQSLGIFEIKTNEIEIDVIAASSYKWQTAGYGAGLIYINEKSREKLKFGALGAGSMTDFLADPKLEKHLKTAPQNLEAGHPKPLHILMQGQALKELEAIGWQAITERVKYLSKLLHSAVVEAGYVPMAPVDGDSWSGIVSFECNRAVHEHLTANNVITTWRPSYLRAAVHFYNNEEDIQLFKSTLLRIKQK